MERGWTTALPSPLPDSSALAALSRCSDPKCYAWASTLTQDRCLLVHPASGSFQSLKDSVWVFCKVRRKIQVLVLCSAKTRLLVFWSIRKFNKISHLFHKHGVFLHRTRHQSQFSGMSSVGSVVMLYSESQLPSKPGSVAECGSVCPFLLDGEICSLPLIQLYSGPILCQALF